MSQPQSKPHRILHIFIINRHLSQVETSPQIFTVIKIKNQFLQKSRKSLGVVGFLNMSWLWIFLVLEKIYVTVLDEDVSNNKWQLMTENIRHFKVGFCFYAIWIFIQYISLGKSMSSSTAKLTSYIIIGFHLLPNFLVF